MSVNILLIVFVLIVIAMIAFILVQKGAGATAGSAFGSGASSTVFGSKGSGNFLTKSTMVLAFLFFGISLLMAVNASREFTTAKTGEVDLGVMGKLDTNNSDVPSITPVSDDTTKTDSDVPALEGMKDMPKGVKVGVKVDVNDMEPVHGLVMKPEVEAIAAKKMTEIKAEATQKAVEVKDAVMDKKDGLKTKAIEKAEELKESIDG